MWVRTSRCTPYLPSVLPCQAGCIPPHMLATKAPVIPKFVHVCLSLVRMQYIYPSTLPMVPLYCMLPSLSPSPRSAPSFKLSPLYVPVSPVPRAERCKPCPVALVPTTLGCSASRSQPLDELRSIRKYNTGIALSYTPKTPKKCSLVSMYTKTWTS